MSKRTPWALSMGTAIRRPTSIRAPDSLAQSENTSSTAVPPARRRAAMRAETCVKLRRRRALL
eukprot:15422823-Heterocapsa_arctica.AAC.1